MKNFTKRQFIKTGLCSMGGAFCIFNSKADQFNFEYNSLEESNSLPVGPGKFSKEAMFYEQTPRGVKCLVCPNECNIKESEAGDCRNRMNFGGKLYSMAYGNPCAVHVDPVEKKPLLHFYPGTYAYSIATAGCNLACLNCQNWTISQTSPLNTKNSDLMPQAVIKETLANNCKSIAYTYSEPLTFYEYTYDTSKLARAQGIKNIIVSAGYIHEKPLRELAKTIDAAHIDLKSFSDSIYVKLNGGSLQPVLDTLKILKEMNVWLEITNLVIPSWTDNLDMIKQMCDWLATNGFANNPLHFCRFMPLYKLTQLPATPVSTLQKAKEIALKSGLNFVYIGNVPGVDENTICPSCKKVVIERKGFTIVENSIVNNRCKFCNKPVPGHWQ